MAEVTPAHSKWVYAVCITGILAILILFSSCIRDTSLIAFSTDDYVAIAFPEALPPEEAANSLAQHGIGTIISEDTVLVPMTDFVRLEYLTLSEVARRVQADDPRQTPLTSLLVSSFTTAKANEPWRIWYVPVDSNAEYQAIQDAFTGTGSDWAWDAQPRSPVLSFLWIIWLIWILWLLATRTVKDRLLHGLLIAAWIPFAFIPGLAATAFMVVGQGVSAILGMHIVAGGLRNCMDRKDIRRLLVNLVPFLLSMVFLLSFDTGLLVPAATSGLMLFLFTRYRESISGHLEKKRLHRYPPFRVILDKTLNVKAARLGLWAIVPLLIMPSLVLFIPFHAGDNARYHLVFDKDPLQRANILDHASMIRTHIVYQEAITWGRLGEARWMTDTYTRPFRFALLDDRIVRSAVDNGSGEVGFQNSSELDKQLRRILEHIKGGTPRVVQGFDSIRNGTTQLDSLGVVFYIMALVPFCLLGLQRAGQSRRRIMTSNSNRQVA
jgi:hypothetical protein